MNKIRLVALGFLAMLFCSGCVSTKALDENYFGVSEAIFHEPGVLELKGEYQESAWGIAELRGMVAGDEIILSGVVERWADGEINHRIAIPAKIKVVKCGTRVLWRRGEAPRRPQPPARPAAPPAAPVAPPAAPASPPAVPAAPPAPPAAPATPSVAPVVQDEQKDQVTHLKIGGEKFNMFLPKWLDFEYIFWGEPVASAADTHQVQIIGGDNSIYDFNAALINQFRNLEVLEIRGTTYIRHADLTGLSLPKLRKLVLDQVEVTGLESADLPALEEFYLNDMRTVPFGRVSLPAALPKLKIAGIQAYAGNFDFASLSGKPLEKLWIISDCRDFGFLQGMPVKHLQLSGFSAVQGALDVLRSLPLESLILKPFRQVDDWSFLRGLRLKRLSVKVAGNGSFSPALLSNMPLESLRISGTPVDFGAAWMSCKDLPLKELVLFNCLVPAEFLRSKPIENIALYNCHWSSDPMGILNELPGVRHLAAWRIIQRRDGTPYLFDRQLDWERFNGRGVESLCISAADLNFLRKFPGVKKLVIREVNVPLALESLRNREFEIFTIPAAQSQEAARYGIKISGPRRIDMITADW